MNYSQYDSFLQAAAFRANWGLGPTLQLTRNESSQSSWISAVTSRCWRTDKVGLQPFWERHRSELAYDFLIHSIGTKILQLSCSHGKPNFYRIAYQNMLAIRAWWFRFDVIESHSTHRKAVNHFLCRYVYEFSSHSQVYLQAYMLLVCRKSYTPRSELIVTIIRKCSLKFMSANGPITIYSDPVTNLRLQTRLMSNEILNVCFQERIT